MTRRGGGVHLIAASVAELGTALDRVAKRAVERAGVLGRIAEDRQVSKTCLVQRTADRGHHAVHHPAGRHQIGPGLSVTDGLATQQFQRGVVVHIRSARRVGQHAAMTVVGIFTKADVGDDQQLGCGLFDGGQALLDNALVAVGVAAVGVLGRGDAEQDQAAQPQGGRLPSLFGGQIGGQLEMSRHRRDRLALVLARAKEQRQNQPGRREIHFPHQGADRRVSPQPPQAGGGKTGLESESHDFSLSGPDAVSKQGRASHVARQISQRVEPLNGQGVERPGCQTVGAGWATCDVLTLLHSMLPPSWCGGRSAGRQGEPGG